jgi:general secretion pathway protein A
VFKENFMANTEQVDILKKGVNTWNQWRKEHPNATIDLKEADLSNIDLLGANFQNANLMDADLTKSRAEKANFRRAHLVRTNFCRAKISSSDFSGANLQSANLYQAWGSHAIFSNAELTRTVLEKAVLIRASDYKIIWVTACSGSIIEFYRQLISEMEIDLSSNSKAKLTKAIKRRVLDLVREKRQQPVIVVDEASLLQLEVFVELHTITQFDFDSKPWLPIILIGQNHVVDRLKFRKSAPLASRVVARSHLSAVGKEDMKRYIIHHLEIAGTKEELFSEEAHRAIFQGSGGLFRKANHLARGSLIAAAKQISQVVLLDHVKAASSEIF